MNKEKAFSTLLKEKDINKNERWYPQSVYTYQCSIKLDYDVENCPALSKNVAYSLQYLEFLEKEFSELSLSSVLDALLIKTYIITGMSVLEGIFSNIVKSRGWWKKAELESIGSTTANETNFGDSKFIVRSELLVKVPAYDMRMDMSELIQILSRHHDALQVNHIVYPALKRLRKLRNRVHLQMLASSTDHDFNAFSFSDKREMGAILYEILTSNMVTNNPKIFDFLKNNVEEV